MSKPSIKTIDEAIKILAYNDWAWNVYDDRLGNDKLAHPKDKSVVLSLAEPRYPWTEKQAKLALGIVKRYATKFESYGIEIRDIIKNPVYEHPFRIINSENLGVLIFEDPSLAEMINVNSYDQIYDEHPHIFSVTALSKILELSVSLN